MTDTKYAAFVGLDWADQEHVIELKTPDGRRETLRLQQDPAAIAEWVRTLTARFGAGRIAVCLESSRGAIVAGLLEYENFVLFPVNPKQLARFREAMYPSGAKNDPADAQLLAEFVQQHRDKLRPWVPNDELTRQMDRCCRSRRKLVDERKRLVQRLRQLLKEYYPAALEMFGQTLQAPLALDFLMRWPSLSKAQRAKSDYLKKFFHQHNCRSRDRIENRIRALRDAQPLTTDPAIVEPSVLMVQALVVQLRQLNKAIATFDAEIARLFARQDNREVFASLPGAGAALAPRLLAALGSQKDRYESATEIQAQSGIAPVRKASGQTQIIHRRYACPKFLRQTFHEFAGKSILYSDWARAYYDLLRERGKRHNAALRALAFKWQRIILRMWKTGELYDEAKYQQVLAKRNSPIAKKLVATT